MFLLLYLVVRAIAIVVIFAVVVFVFALAAAALGVWMVAAIVVGLLHGRPLRPHPVAPRSPRMYYSSRR